MQMSMFFFVPVSQRDPVKPGMQLHDDEAPGTISRQVPPFIH